MPNSAQEPVINYEDIITYISEEIQYVWKELVASEDESVANLISNIKGIIVSDEQFFRKQEANRALRRGTVYLIVRFSAGSINYASSVTPVSIYGLGVANQVKPVQLLLGTFASYWTTKNLRDGLTKRQDGQTQNLIVSDMLQVWNTPEVISNFNVVDDDFRNLYRVTGNIVIGPEAIRVGTLTYYYGEGSSDYETINIMSFQDGYRTSLDSQPFGNTNGFTQSEVNFQTYTFSISTYLLNSHLARDLLAIRGFRYRPNGTYNTSTTGAFSLKDPNNIFKIKIDFTNDFNNMPGSEETTDLVDPVKGDDFYMKFKVVDSGINQEIGGIPVLNITFVR